MFQNPAVKRWLGGVEPAWTLLDQASFEALRRPLSRTGGGPVRLAADLTPDEVERSPVASNAEQRGDRTDPLFDEQPSDWGRHLRGLGVRRRG
jgi:hypothetical protein